MPPKKGLQKLLSNISSRVGQKSKLKADVSEPEEPWINITPSFSLSQGSPNELVPADYWDPTANTENGSMIASDSSSSSYGEPNTHYPRSSFNSPASAYSPDERHTGSARESVSPNPYYLGNSEQNQENSVPLVYRASSTARHLGTLNSRVINSDPVAHGRGPNVLRSPGPSAIPQGRFEQIPKNRLRPPSTSTDPLLQSVTAGYDYDSRSDNPGILYSQIKRLDQRNLPAHGKTKSDDFHDHDQTKQLRYAHGRHHSSRPIPPQNTQPHTHTGTSAYAHGSSSLKVQDVQSPENSSVDDYFQHPETPEKQYQWAPNVDISQGIYSADIFGYPTHRPPPPNTGQNLHGEYTQPIPQFAVGPSSPPLLNIPVRGQRQNRRWEGPGRSISQENDYSHLFRPGNLPASAPAVIRNFSAPVTLPSESAARERMDNEGEKGVGGTGELRSAPIGRYEAYRAAIEEAELQKATAFPPHSRPSHSQPSSSVLPGFHRGYR